MALTDGDNGNGFYMPVAPAYGGGNGGFGWGGDLSWIILLLLCGWGGGFGFGGMGGMMGGMLGYDFPWLMTGQQNINTNTNNGFRDAMLNDGITGISNRLSDISTQLRGGFAGVNSNISNGFAQSEISANSRQMASMNQNFGLQTAMMQGFNQLGSQFADCCCENRLANCQTQNIIQNEGNATRFADAQNTRDIIEASNAKYQGIMDKLCQLELDGYKTQLDAKNDTIAQLRADILYARGQASQDVQTAELRANNATVANQLLSEMRSCPIPAQPVYGSQPIFTCNGNNGGCGCSGNSFFN